MPFSPLEKAKIRKMYMTGVFNDTPLSKSQLSILEEEDPEFLGSLRQAATDWRASLRPPDPAPARGLGPLAGLAREVKGMVDPFYITGGSEISPTAIAVKNSVDLLTAPLEMAAAHSANVPLSSGRGALDKGLAMDVLDRLAGEGEAAPQIDILKDSALNRLPDAVEAPARAALQGAAELGMAVPGLGSAVGAAVETKAPAALDLPRHLVRGIGEFVLGGPMLASASAGSGAYAQGGAADDAAVAGLATAAGGALGKGLNPTAVANAAGAKGVLGAVNRALSKTVASGTMPGYAAAEALSVAAIDVPSAIATNPDIAASLAEGESLTDEQKSRLTFEVAASAMGSGAGLAVGALEGHGARKAAKRIEKAIEVEREVLNTAAFEPEARFGLPPAAIIESPVKASNVDDTITAALPTRPGVVVESSSRTQEATDGLVSEYAGAEAIQPTDNRTAAGQIDFTEPPTPAPGPPRDFGPTSPALLRAIGYRPEALAEAAALRAEGRAEEAKAAEASAVPALRAAPMDRRTASDLLFSEIIDDNIDVEAVAAVVDYSGQIAKSLRAKREEGLRGVAKNSRKAYGRVQSAKRALAEAEASGDAAAISAATTEYRVAKQNLDIDDFASGNEVLGRIFQVVRDAPDAIRGQIVKRIQVAGQTSRNLRRFDDFGAADYREARAAEVERLVGVGAVRDRAEADGLIKSLEGQKAHGQAVRQLDALATAHAPGRAAGRAATAAQGKGLGLDLDLGDEVFYSDKAKIRNEALAAVATAAMYGKPATRLARASDKVLATVGWATRLGRVFSNDAAVLSAAAAGGDWRAGLAHGLLAEARNKENEMKTVLKVGFHNQIDRQGLTRKEYEFVNNRHEDFLSYLAGSGTREDLVDRLSQYGHKKPESSTLVKIYDSWNGVDGQPGLKAIAAKMLNSIGINTRDDYFPHSINPYIRERLRNAGAEERDKTIAEIVRADALQRVTRGEFEFESAAANKRADTLSAALSAAFDPEAIYKGASLAELAKTMENPEGTEARGSVKDPAMASLIKTRELDLPEFLEDGTPVLVRDPIQLIETYINGISRVGAMRTTLGSDDTGIPSRLLPVFKSMDNSLAKNAVESLYRELSLGAEYGFDFMEKSFGKVGVAKNAMAITNAASNIGRSISVSGSHLSQLLSYAALFRDLGLRATALGVTPFVGKNIVKRLARDRVAAGRDALTYVKHLHDSGKDVSESRAIKAYFDLVNGLMMDHAKLAHERLHGLADAPELSAEIAPDWRKDRLGFASAKIEQGGNALARGIHRYTGIEYLNNLINAQSARGAVNALDGLHDIMKNGTLSQRADVAYDLKNVFGISDVKRFTETGPTDADRINAARSIRARVNASDMSALERPSRAKTWVGRTLFALQSISMVQAAAFSQEIDRIRTRGFRFRGPSTPGKKMLAVAGGAIASGLFLEAIQTLSDQTQPTDSEIANLALESAGQLGFAPEFLQRGAYALRFKEDPYSFIISQFTGGAPGLMKTAQLANGVYRLGGATVEGEDQEKELENLRKQIPLIRRLSDLHSSGAEFPENAGDRLQKAIDESEAMLPIVGPLVESLGEIYDLLEDGAEARKRRWRDEQ